MEGEVVVSELVFDLRRSIRARRDPVCTRQRKDRKNKALGLACQAPYIFPDTRFPFLVGLD